MSCLRELVPRTYREAIVAAVNPVAHLFAQIKRNRAFMFDREVGNAAAGIQLIRRWKRRRRADVETGPAGTAVIRLRLVNRQFQRRENRAEKQPRAEFARNQIGMLALPAKPRRRRRRRERLFHDGRGVDEHLDFGAGLGDEPAAELLQFALDEFVIVVAARIHRNRAALARFEQCKRIFVRPVIHAEHDHAFRFGPQHLRVGASVFRSREPFHVAVRAVRDPRVEIFSERSSRRLCDAERIEAFRSRSLAQRL